MRRPRHGGDALGLRHALGDRTLPLLVGAMAFLAALAAGGLVGAQVLARHWQGGARSMLTAQVPSPDDQAGTTTRAQAALVLLRTQPTVLAARALDPSDVAALLRPWLGGAPLPPDLKLPGVIDLQLLPGTDPATASHSLAARLAAAVPGATVDDAGAWAGALARLAASLRTCAELALAVVTAVASLIVAGAVRGGVVARRQAIVIAHGLGATDDYIARQFARRATALSFRGAAVGVAVALPVLAALARLAAPFTAAADVPDPAATLPVSAWWRALPTELWAGLAALPAVAGGIGFTAAQGTVRHWLRRLP